MRFSNNCTLLIDGNWLLMSRSSMDKEGFLIGNEPFRKEIAINECVELMSKSISLTLNRFDGIIDNVILVSDGKSWRKSIEKPASLEAEYKGTRVRTEEKDWDAIFSCLSKLEEACKENGITVAHSWHAEGDDNIWYWSKTLLDDGVNSIIWSSDNDLKQLVEYENGSWVVWYNDRYGLFADRKFLENETDELAFMMQDASSARNIMMLEEISSKAELNVNYINPEEIVMEKIICGDSSDNIKAVVRIKSGSKTYSVTPKMWQKAKEDLEINTLEDFFANKDSILDSLYSLKKFKGTTMTREDVDEQFEYNTRLVWLDVSTIPQEVQSEMAETLYTQYDVEYLKGNYKVLSGDTEGDEVERLFS